MRHEMENVTLTDLSGRDDRAAMNLSFYWTWDARRIGMGRTPAEDDVFTTMEGLTIPTAVTLDFPVGKAHALMSSKNRKLFEGVPLVEMTRLQCHIHLLPSDS